MQLKQTNQSANSTAVVLIVMTALMGLVAASIEYTQGLGRYANRSRSNVTAQAIGDACLELAFSQWRQICRNTLSVCTVPCAKNKPPATSAFAGIALPTAAMFPDIPNFTATSANDQSFTVSNYKVQAVDTKITLTSADPPVSSLATTTEPPAYSRQGGWVYGGLKSNYHYLASCDVTLPSPSGPVTTKMRRVFQKKINILNEYFMFFNDDLELQPSSSSPLTIYGAIHTNGKLYTGTSALTADATNPILTGRIAFYSSTSITSGIAPTNGITYADDWINGFKPGDTIHTEAPAKPTIISSAPPSRGPNLQIYDWDPNAWNATDADTTNDSPHELIELPPASGTDFMAKSIWDQSFYTNLPAGVERMSKNCQIRINIAANDVVTIFGKTSSGTEVQLNATMTGPGTNPIYAGYYGYQCVFKMWTAALGLNYAGNYLPLRSFGSAKTTAASATLTSTAGNFQTTDLGRVITGPNIPVGTTITARASTSSITLSKLATASGTNLTVTIGSASGLTNTSIQDNREGGLVDMVDIDCDVYKNWDPQTAYAPGHILRYQNAIGLNLAGMGNYLHADPRTNSGRKRAIRIKNGGLLTQTNDDTAYSPPYKISSSANCLVNLTTDNPLYIWGDFNSGRVPIATTNHPVNTTTIPACNNDATKLTYIYETVINGPFGSGITIFADAVTLLSNNWSDSNSTAPLSSRIASNTTVNCNIVAGNVPTSATNGYSGGGENFIRLMEDWSGGKRFTFTGSMAQLFQSKTATGKWVPPGTAGNVYNEPTRNWYWRDGNYYGGGTGLNTVAYTKHRWSPAP